MRLDFQSIKPIYLQIAEAIEDDILSGKLPEGCPAYSQLTLSRELSINPATAAKGINVLVHNGILIKERGKSMMVAPGARLRLVQFRQEDGLKPLVADLVAEANKIDLSKDHLLQMIDECYSQHEQFTGGLAHE